MCYTELQKYDLTNPGPDIKGNLTAVSTQCGTISSQSSAWLLCKVVVTDFMIISI